MKQSSNDLIINFAPTGMKPTKDWTPYVPIDPVEIVEQVHEAYETGITLVHLHARETATGMPTYKASIYDNILSPLRKYCPDLVLGISTSGRRFKEFEERSEVLQLYPDMASLTLSSLNFLNDAHLNEPEMIQRLAISMEEYGVHPELEVFESGMINYGKYLISKEIIKPPFYWNVIFGNIFTAQPDMATVGLTIRDLPPGSIYCIAGLGASQLTITMHGVASGAGVRVGLEDNVYYDSKKEVLATNLALIRRVHVLAEIFERKIMKPSDFGKLGFYNIKRIKR